MTFPKLILEILAIINYVTLNAQIIHLVEMISEKSESID